MDTLAPMALLAHLLAGLDRPHIYVTLFRRRSADRYTGVHNPTVMKHMNRWNEWWMNPIFRRLTTRLEPG